MKINGTFLGGIANIFDYEKLKTTELISFNPPFSVQGPITLKEPLFSHCSVLVQDKVYVFERQFTNTSISISIHNGAIDYDYMPKMPQNIYNPSCASFYDGNKTYIAVVGGYPLKTEIFDIQQNVWFQGMKMDYQLVLRKEIYLQNL